MASAVEVEIWARATDAYAGELLQLLGEALDSYERKPGRDDIARITPGYIGETGYCALLGALKLRQRRDVSYIDHGWHVELRSRLWTHMVRSVQRFLVSQGDASELITEDLLGHDLGM